MEQFELQFDGGTVSGQGTDIVGPFLFRGEYDAAGKVRLVKQYIARHAVVYHGEPDGEGSILGTWSIDVKQFGVAYRGPFLMQRACLAFQRCNFAAREKPSASS